MAYYPTFHHSGRDNKEHPIGECYDRGCFDLNPSVPVYLTKKDKAKLAFWPEMIAMLEKLLAKARAMKD